MNSATFAASQRASSTTANELALFTDLYELTMAQAYFEESFHDDAVFSLFVRRLPQPRNLLIACGLDGVLEYLEQLQFGDEGIAYLRSLGKFSDRFLDWLRDLRFTGEIRAVAEGTPIFANEPILEVTAPLPQAQLIETLVMNQIHLQTVLASKAHRMVSAAEGRTVVDFGSRRTHGLDAGLKAARAAYIVGLKATSNVLAGFQYGIPVVGTMAHSYIQAHASEAAAFEAFARLYPRTVLLVDTYDTLEGIRRVIELAERQDDDFRAQAVRLDSGDLGGLAREARKMLSAAGLDDMQILVSGGLDEDEIAELVTSNAPIDGYCVGTGLGVSSDAPSLDIAYKLCEYAGKGRLKLSSGKPILPGQKQVFRREQDGEYIGDTIGRATEDLPGRPLLQTVMRAGQRLDAGRRDLDTIREDSLAEISRLPPAIRQITPVDPGYPVQVSQELTSFQRSVADQVAADNH